VLTHVLYGFGFWRGLFTKLNLAHDKSPTQVIIERVEPGMVRPSGP
jgi:hypothetical protein